MSANGCEIGVKILVDGKQATTFTEIYHHGIRNTHNSYS